MVSRAAAAEFKGSARFELGRRLGAGGTGVVYEAFDRDHKARVALKVLRHVEPEALRLFKNEFRALREMRHPNLVSLGELFEADGHWFFTMELLEGREIVSHVRRGQGRAFDPVTPATVSARAAVPASRQTPKSAERPEEQSFDEARLRRAMLQLAQGLAALHAFGKVHRDVKSSNVLVTREERTVVLDFGLVADFARPNAADEGAIVGTIAYMAPEQALGQRVGPPADWYAFGVLLYRLLTGAYPFAGTLEEVATSKQLAAPTPPERVARGIPPDLDRLCMALLDADPERRPTAEQVVKRLAPAAPAQSIDTRQAAVFVGRHDELAALRGALDAVVAGAQVTVRVRGESGVGKSALVRRFCDLAAADGGLALVGRCDEREWMRYKALDGIVDALARHLARLPRPEVAPLLPSGVDVLAQVFPTMRLVEGVSGAGDPAHAVVNPQERRSRMAAALRELLARVADRQPLVVVVDDVQWADPDSVALLRDIVSAPSRPKLLLVFTERDDIAPRTPTSHPEGPPAHDERTMHLRPLLPEEARSLAASLLAERAGREGQDATTIAAEANGHPLFIAELVRYACDDAAESEPTRVEDALWSRIQRLDRAARAVLQVVCVAGGPLPDDVAAHAAAMDFAEFSKHQAVLRIAHLVRSAGVPKRDSLEPYHDKTRRAVLAHMEAAEVTKWHARIALALEAMPHADPEALATHWGAAGHSERGARYLSVAAEQADTSLAFERAVELYTRAVELRPPDAAEMRRLKERLANALASVGRGADAAAAFLEASVGAPEGPALELRRRAADQLVLCGRVEQGLTVMQGVLGAVGSSMPRTPLAAVLVVVWLRLLLAMRGLGYVLRDPSRVTPHTMTRLEVWWSVARGLGMVDTVRGAAFQIRHLWLALRVGEPTHLLRAFCIEAAFSASDGWRRHARTERVLLETARVSSLVEPVDPLAPAWLGGASGCAAFLEGRWKRARAHLESTATILRERFTGAAWEYDTVEAYLVGCDYALGELAVLRKRVLLLVGDARARGDVYATTHLLSGVVPAAWLAQGDVATARQMADEALAPWRTQETHRIAHFMDLQARTNIDLFDRPGPEALARVRESWPRLRTALLFRVEYVRVVCLDLRARALLAASGKRPNDEPALLAEAASVGRRLSRMLAPWARALGQAACAGVAAARGDDASAVTELRRAAASFDACDMAMHAAVVRDRLAALVGGAEGKEQRAQADAWFAGEAVRERERLVAVLAPGYRAAVY